MSNGPEIHGSDLRGMSRLAFDGIAGLIGMVETMHGNIAGHSGLAPWAEGKTRGITRLVYRSIRGVTHLTGAGVDAALSLLDPILTVEHPTPSRAARRAVINGVLGDHLAETSNPLAIPMRLRHRGRPLRLERNSLTEALTPPSGRLVVLLHGLCLNDRHWHRDGHDHGAALARDLGLACTFPPTGGLLLICCRRLSPSGRCRSRNWS